MGIIFFIINALEIIIIVDVILSWVMQDPDAFPRNITRQITEPLYAPIHAILDPRKMGGIDISPLIVIGLLWLAKSALSGAM